MAIDHWLPRTVQYSNLETKLKCKQSAVNQQAPARNEGFVVGKPKEGSPERETNCRLLPGIHLAFRAPQRKVQLTAGMESN